MKKIVYKFTAYALVTMQAAPVHAMLSQVARPSLEAATKRTLSAYTARPLSLIAPDKFLIESLISARNTFLSQQVGRIFPSGILHRRSIPVRAYSTLQRPQTGQWATTIRMFPEMQSFAQRLVLCQRFMSTGIDPISTQKKLQLQEKLQELKDHEKEPWKMLGIKRTATPEEIAKARRELRLEYHPDRVQGDEENSLANQITALINRAGDTMLQNDDQSTDDQAYGRETVNDWFGWFSGMRSEKERPLSWEEQLFKAAECENITFLQQLLTQGGGFNNLSREDATELFSVAAAQANREAAELLLNAPGATQKININGRDPYGRTPLLRAVDTLEVEDSKKFETVKWLLEKSADAKVADKTYGKTPLHAAADQAVKLVQLLLEHGADPKAINEFKETPLDIAAQYGSCETVQVLLNAGAEPDRASEYGNRPLHRASKSGNAEAIRILLEAGVDPHATTANGSTSLHYAAKSGNVEAMQLLLDAGINVHAVENNNTTTLHYAAESGNEKAVLLLLEAGVKPDAVDNHGDTALHNAARENNAESVRILLNAGTNPNGSGCWGHTPLYNAAQVGNAESVRLLLEAGADPHAVAEDGSTPLHTAAYHNAEVVRLLLKAGANPNVKVKDIESETPLHRAVTTGDDDDIIRELLAGKADPNIPNGFARVPLHYAISRYAADGHGLERIGLLADAGANPNIADDRGETPLGFARSHRLHDVVKLLQEKQRA